MSIEETVSRVFPPVLSATMLLVFGIVLALDWVSLARGDKQTPLMVTVVATAMWLAFVATGVVTWTT